LWVVAGSSPLKSVLHVNRADGEIPKFSTRCDCLRQLWSSTHWAHWVRDVVAKSTAKQQLTTMCCLQLPFLVLKLRRDFAAALSHF